MRAGITWAQLRRELAFRLQDLMDPVEATAEASRWLGEGFGLDRARLATRGTHPVPSEDLRRVEGWLNRRLAGEPWPMVLGWTAFRGRRFAVRAGVLVPQLESEAVVTAALELGRELGIRRCVDVGAGAGNIGLSLALETGWELTLTEIDPAALGLVEENAARLGARVRTLLGDLLDPVPDPLELVVANMPFVPESRAWDLQREFRFEPAHTMLSPGGIGLAARLLDQAFGRGARACIVEIGAGQGEALRCSVLESGWPRVAVDRDAHGQDRLIQAWR